MVPIRWAFSGLRVPSLVRCDNAAARGQSPPNILPHRQNPSVPCSVSDTITEVSPPVTSSSRNPVELPILTTLGPSSPPAPSCIIGPKPLLTDSLQHDYLRLDRRRRKTQKEPIFLTQSSIQQYKSDDSIRTLDLFHQRTTVRCRSLPGRV